MLPEYDSFFYETQRVELSDALDIRGEDLLPIYDKDALYCPECEVAQLTFTRKTSNRRAFLSTRKASSSSANLHSENCSHRLNRATKSQTRQYYRELTGSQVNDKLDAVINQYLRQQMRKEGDGELVPYEQNSAVAQIRERDRKAYKRLPKRSFYSIYDITDEELDVPILLYGSVKMKLEELPSKYGDKTYFKLNILRKDSGRLLRYFYFNHFGHISEEASYYVALIAVFSKPETKLRSKPYSQWSIRYQLVDGN